MFMTYQALYRKYRPAVFEDMAGQKQIVQTLQNAIAADRISHAYLFCGPRGTGKTSAAKIFARALNCTSDQTRPCGHCENCLAADHPDIIEIDAASNNGVEEARNLVERVKYTPMLGKYKVYIIDEVHMMTAGAFNALLKTIEEPPAHVVFILATTEPHKVLPTILSRCQRFDFKKVTDDEIEERLLSVAQRENTLLDPEAAAQIAMLADGGMRDALSILDQCIAYESEHLKAEDIRTVYGVVAPTDIAEIFSDMAHGHAETVIRSVKEIYDNGLDLERFTADLISLIKDSLILAYSEETTLIAADRKKLLSEKFLNSPLSWRKDLLNALMELYPKFAHASSVLDYLEAVILRYIDPENSEVSDKDVKANNESIGSSERRNDIHSAEITSKSDEAQKKSEGMNPESDVSRETSVKKKESQTVDRKIRYTTEEIVGLLHTADKTRRQKDMIAWDRRSLYGTSLQYGKYTRMISSGVLAASGEEYIVVYTPRQLEADAINDLQLDDGFSEFIEKLTGTSKTIFAVPVSQYKDALGMFRECMKSGTFPPPPEVRQTGKKENHMKTTEEDMREIFPNLKIIHD